MNLAEQAVKEFNETGIIPDLGQCKKETLFGTGTAYTFPDGSIAAHWNDGAFLVAEMVEDD